jgi:hypothetical protein
MAKVDARVKFSIMGDASDFADVERFTRTREGQDNLERFREGLIGKRIVGVESTNLSTGVAFTLLLDDGDHLDLSAALQSYSVESLRDRFSGLLLKEYYKDFPERKPGRRMP